MGLKNFKKTYHRWKPLLHFLFHFFFLTSTPWKSAEANFQMTHMPIITAISMNKTINIYKI
ncbi:hypothetical protein V6Z12_A09G232000 [Gossypium hirsutum]